MKKTDLLRKERELRRARKKEEKLSGDGRDNTPGYYIKELHQLFFHDETRIYNIESDEKILDLILEMRDSLEEKHWEAVFSKAIKKTGIKEKESARKQLEELMELAE
jgi:predicted Zn-dependent protease